MAVALDLAPSEVERVAEASPELLISMRTARAERWTTETELLAGIYEIMHATYRLTASAAGVKKDELPAPVRVPRPGNQTEKKPAMSGAELRQWMTARGGNK